MEVPQRDWETLLELEESLTMWLLQGSASAYGLPWSSTESSSEEDEDDEDIPAVSWQFVEVWNEQGGIYI